MLNNRSYIRKCRYFQFFSGWGSHLFFQKKDGTLHACGRNSSGECSIENIPFIKTPTKVKYFPPNSKRTIKVVSVGRKHTLYLTQREGAFSSGKNDNGQLSDGTTDSRDMAVRVILVNKDETIIDVVAGCSCSYFLTFAGDVYSSGANTSGQLGRENAGSGFSFTSESNGIADKIRTLTGIMQIVTGSQWAMFLARNRKIFAVGYNSDGELAIGEKGGNKKVPVEVSYFARNNIKVDFLSATFSTIYFITEGGLVYCAGCSSSGEFGNGILEDTPVPVISHPLSNCQLFFSGGNYGHCLIKKNDKLFGNGCSSGRFGMKGDANVLRSSPLNFPDEKRVKQITTAYYNSYVICENGDIYSTGSGGFGQLMTGSSVASDEFTYVGRYNLRRTGELGSEDKRERLEFLRERYLILDVVVFVILC